MPAARRLAGAAIGACGGALAAALALVGLGRAAQAPPGWTLDTGGRPPVAVYDAQDPPRPDRWRLEPLAAWRAAEVPAALEVEALLDPTDRLELQWGATRVELGHQRRLHVEGPGCRLPEVGVGARVALRAARTADALQLEIDGQAGACPLPEGPPVLRTGAGRVHLAALAVDGAPVPPPLAPAAAAAALLAGAVAGGLLGARLGLLALAPLPGLLLALALGLADPAALAERLRIAALAAPRAAPLLGLALGGLGLALVLAFRRARLRPGVGGLAAWLPGPLLGLAWGLPVALRAPPAVDSALAIALGGAAAWALFLALGRPLAGQPPGPAAAAAAAVSGLGAATLLAARLAGLQAPYGLAWAGVVGAALGGILWANRNAVRGFNLLSLGLALLLLAGLEQAAGSTRAAAGWRQAAGWVARADPARDPRDEGDLRLAAEADFADLEAARFTAYPSRGYPVAFGPRAAPQRVVALGGSSTGGAWQMADLRRFWPARLDASLGEEVEVVNQGVGGWTTFHIARYLERQAAALDAGLYVLYVGNNDSGGGYPASLATLYAARQRQRGALSLALQRLVLVQWALQVRQAPRPGGGTRAVTLPELADNLDTVRRLAQASGARVLLVGEANSEVNPELQPYHAALEGYAAQHAGVGWLDGDRLLGHRPVHFLDTVHLSDEGHSALAAGIAREIAAQGLLEPR